MLWVCGLQGNRHTETLKSVENVELSQMNLNTIQRTDLELTGLECLIHSSGNLWQKPNIAHKYCR
jgi:hypothetical protein